MLPQFFLLIQLQIQASRESCISMHAVIEYTHFLSSRFFTYVCKFAPHDGCLYTMSYPCGFQCQSLGSLTLLGLGVGKSVSVRVVRVSVWILTRSGWRIEPNRVENANPNQTEPNLIRFGSVWVGNSDQIGLIIRVKISVRFNSGQNNSGQNGLIIRVKISVQVNSGQNNSGQFGL